jgi:hypothetical protein
VRRLAIALACVLMAVAGASEKPAECLEDMPCFDCRVMGNQVCG